MKSLFSTAAILVPMLLVAAPKQKAVVYVDHFIPVPGANCQIKQSEVQILQDRIVGNVTSSRKYEVVERENLAKVQKELHMNLVFSVLNYLYHLNFLKLHLKVFF